jgi:hypothetical protein
MTKFASPLIALAGLLSAAGPAAAAWDNVFQVCCNNCRPKARASYYAAAPADACPPKQEVRYEQRCYYEPVTVMKAERYTEGVPVQVKSYYYEPVTSYTRASYYDPCTGCPQDVCVPRTSYVRKEQCNTVMRYVERMRMVPTQVNRKVCESRPVVTYYGPTTKTYDCASCELPATGSAGAAPRVDELRANPPSVAPESGSSGGTIPPQTLPTIPQSFPRTAPQSRPYAGPVNARTTSRGAAAAVRGEVVQPDQVTPKAGAKLVFVSATNTEVREYAAADAFGHFEAKLPAGDWYVYLGNGDGRASFHKKVSLSEADARDFKVVSR